MVTSGDLFAWKFHVGEKVHWFMTVMRPSSDGPNMYCKVGKYFCHCMRGEKLEAEQMLLQCRARRPALPDA